MSVDDLVSVIVPVYNVEKYLERCVDSIICQTYCNLEIILVDDGSTDGSGSICDDYKKKDSRIIVIHKKNGGLSDARNAGLDIAKGKFISFVDSDDYIDQKMLHILYSLANDNGSDIAICGLCDCYETGIYEHNKEIFTQTCTNVEALRYSLLGTYYGLSVCTQLISREIIGEQRFSVGKTYEDVFFTPTLFLKAKKISFTTENLYYYWRRPYSITSMKYSSKACDVIEACTYNSNIIKNNCPELLEYAEFRVYWAYFTVFDRMLLMSDYKQIEEYNSVKGYLKKHFIDILTCQYFQKTRRISALVLKVNVSLYRVLVLVQNKRLEINK